MKNTFSIIIIAALFAFFINACGNSLDYQGNSSNDDNSVNDSYNDNSVNGSASPRPSGIPGVNPLCTEVMGVDGAEGFLFKPVSESDGNLVVLFPKEFTKPFLKVEITTLLGVVEEGVFSSVGNGDRMHYRFSMPGSFYQGRIVAFDDNQECVWEVTDTSVRQD